MSRDAPASQFKQLAKILIFSVFSRSWSYHVILSRSAPVNCKIALFAGWVQQPAAVGRSVWCISLNLKMFVPLASHHHCWAGKWWYCRSTYQIKLSSNLLGSSHPIDHDVGQCISPFSPSTKTVAIESDTMEPVEGLLRILALKQWNFYQAQSPDNKIAPELQRRFFENFGVGATDTGSMIL